MQQAFVHTNFPDESPFTPLSIGTVHGICALQTNLVEKCLFIARRSTLQVFATGYTGTVSAVANVCGDVLGHVLPEILGCRAGLTASLNAPGSDRALGQTALSFVQGAAGKGLRGVQGAVARAGSVAQDAAGGEAPASAQRRDELSAI